MVGGHLPLENGIIIYSVLNSEGIPISGGTFIKGFHCINMSIGPGALSV